MDELELIVDNKKIKLVVNSKQWCKLYFIQNDNIFKLGADDLGVIISKLMIAFVSNVDRKYVLYKGEQMFTIFCLMEPHTTITGRDINNSGLELFCIKDGGEIIPLVTLSIEDIRRWIIQLTDFMINYNKNC